MPTIEQNQLQLDVAVSAPITRSRVVVINDDTLEPGRTVTDSPCGCLTCCGLHDGHRWTNRAPHEFVYRFRHAMYCADHIGTRLTEARRARPPVSEGAT